MFQSKVFVDASACCSTAWNACCATHPAGVVAQTDRQSNLLHRRPRTDLLVLDQVLRISCSAPIRCDEASRKAPQRSDYDTELRIPCSAPTRCDEASRKAPRRSDYDT